AWAVGVQPAQSLRGTFRRKPREVQGQTVGTRNQKSEKISTQPCWFTEPCRARFRLWQRNCFLAFIPLPIIPLPISLDQFSGFLCALCVPLRLEYPRVSVVLAREQWLGLADGLPCRQPTPTGRGEFVWRGVQAK